MTKLKEADIRDIRHKAKSVTQVELARQYNLGKTTINNIVLDKTWKHVK